MLALPITVIVATATAIYHVCTKLLSNPSNTTCRLSALTWLFGSLNPMASVFDALSPGARFCSFADKRFMKMLCAADTKTADPKYCAKRMIANQILASLGEWDI
jgi:hypothetical protein